MKIVKILWLPVLFILFIATKCEKYSENYITIKNNSNTDIYYLPSFSYPDTLLKQSEYPPAGNKISKHSEDKNITGSPFFEMNKTLIIFIFDADTVEKVPWDTIVKKYYILKRYEVTKQDMENMDWTITYP